MLAAMANQWRFIGCSSFRELRIDFQRTVSRGRATPQGASLGARIGRPAPLSHPGGASPGALASIRMAPASATCRQVANGALSTGLPAPGALQELGAARRQLQPLSRRL